MNRAKAEMGVSAAPLEVAAARRQLALNAPDPQKIWAQQHDRAQALVDGLTAVYNQGQDPQHVYQETVAGHGVSQNEWLQQVYANRTQAARDKLAQTLSWTPNTFAQSLANVDAQYFAEGQKLEAAIDQRIAATDPTFRSFLGELASKTQHPDSTTTKVAGMPRDHMQYIDQARSAWWKAEKTKVRVTLSDPTLTSQCTGLTDPPPSPFNH